MSLFLSQNCIRNSFRKSLTELTPPDLIKVQKQSYKNFLQLTINSEKKEEKGLEEILRCIFNIIDVDSRVSVDYMSYNIIKCDDSPNLCIANGLSYNGALKINIRLILWYINLSSGLNEIYAIKDQYIFLADIPLMTHNGTFIINGTQRVVVSQLYRSPGIIYNNEEKYSDKLTYSAKIIPFKGSWLNFEFD